MTTPGTTSTIAQTINLGTTSTSRHLYATQSSTSPITSVVIGAGGQHCQLLLQRHQSRDTDLDRLRHRPEFLTHPDGDGLTRRRPTALWWTPASRTPIRPER